MWTGGFAAAVVAVLLPFESGADRSAATADSGDRRREKAETGRFRTACAEILALLGRGERGSGKTWIWPSLGLQFAGALALLIAVYLRGGEAAAGQVAYTETAQGWLPHDRWFEIVLIGAILSCGVPLLTGYRRLTARNRRTDTLLRSVSGSLSQVVEEKFEAWGLSSAERDIANLAIKGCSTADIARLRQTSEVTIRVQFSTIYRKAGVDGRVQLVGQLIEGLMDISSCGAADRRTGRAPARKTGAENPD